MSASDPGTRRRTEMNDTARRSHAPRLPLNSPHARGAPPWMKTGGDARVGLSRYNRSCGQAIAREVDALVGGLEPRLTV